MPANATAPFFFTFSDVVRSRLHYRSKDVVVNEVCGREGRKEDTTVKTSIFCNSGDSVNSRNLRTISKKTSKRQNAAHHLKSRHFPTGTGV